MKRCFLWGRSVSRVVGVLAVGMLLVISGCKEEEKVRSIEAVRPVKSMTIEVNNGMSSISLPGRVRASQRTELAFKVDGPLVRLPVEEGRFVKKGALIAQILPRDFQTAINEAHARQLEAEQQYERYKELYSKRQVSKADFDRYRASRNVARAQLQDARNALQDTKLLAPFDGVIARREVENYEKVTRNQVIVSLQSIRKLEVLIDVPELMMSQFAKGTEVDIVAEFDALPNTMHALSLKEYSTEADPTTQTYRVVLQMDQPKQAQILPGMTAKVRVVERNDDRGGAVVIPAIAVLSDKGQECVWLIKGDTVTKRQVVLHSLAGHGDAIVSEGLESGEQIVIAGVTKLREGMKVRLWENQREGK